MSAMSICVTQHSSFAKPCQKQSNNRMNTEVDTLVRGDELGSGGFVCIYLT
jgi:hypothetical protein